MYIIDAAGSFLNSGSEFQYLLNRIELAGTGSDNYSEWAQTCSTAAAYMQKAEINYNLLVQLLENAPLNPVMSGRLISFDYDGFQKKKKLNATIFAEVKTYLAKGDVRGLFGHMFSASVKIQGFLNRVKSSLDAGIFPGLEMLWRLNEDYAVAMLFGQYAAEVFYEIDY